MAQPYLIIKSKQYVMCIGVLAWLAACSGAPQVQDSEPQQDTASTKDRKEEKGVEAEQEEPFSPLMQAMYSHPNRRSKKLTCLDGTCSPKPTDRSVWKALK